MNFLPNRFVITLTILFAFLLQTRIQAQEMLGEQLAVEEIGMLAEKALQQGNAQRGAMVFFRPELTCAKCHITMDSTPQLGPEIFRDNAEIETVFLIESLLHPSREIKKNYETAKIETLEGKTVSGLLVENNEEQIIVRDMASEGKQRVFHKDDVDRWKIEKTSIMPEGLVNLLANRQEFYDLVVYLREIADGGARRALQLRPPASLYAVKPLPAYESDLDHAGLLTSLDRQSLQRGEQIYSSHCANCHGTHDAVGSLPTSLRFASGNFKNGNDPYTMYKTLTHGYGMMVAQNWMVPQQKYDVIHYIREKYLKTHNEKEYVSIGDDYLASLPKGSSRGPAANNERPWTAMNYGPTMSGTFEVGRDAQNFAYKGIAVRLDAGPGGIAAGEYWMLYDHDTMRVAGGWSGRGFIDWKGIHFDGAHNIHPRISGKLHFQNKNGPGWADGRSKSNADAAFQDVRLVGRDSRRYGPLPRDWAHYKGLYHYGDKAVLEYTVGDTIVNEMPGIYSDGDHVAFTRTFNIGPRKRPLTLQVANFPGPIKLLGQSSTDFVIADLDPAIKQKVESREFRFENGSHLVADKALNFDTDDLDYSIVARIKTRKDGTIFSQSTSGNEWVPNGKTFFVRGGKLAFDIGWVGAVGSRKKVADNKWHDVVATWREKDGRVRLFVDGEKVGEGNLNPKQPLDDPVSRIGFTAEEFPANSAFNGQIQHLQLIQADLSDQEIDLAQRLGTHEKLIAEWDLHAIEKKQVVDSAANVVARLVTTSSSSNDLAPRLTMATVSNELSGDWSKSKDDNLRLKIPAGEKLLRFTLYVAAVENEVSATALANNLPVDELTIDLDSLKHGGSARWNEVIERKPIIGKENGPFAVDTLVHPRENPWECRARLTGFDFYEDADQAAVCAWDGSVWHVSGLSSPQQSLKWRRIASGLFQPLGLRIIDGKIYVMCRDQLAILHDLNNDGEIDYYQNFNNDHQVTDHFHEFAMGLQTDDEGNFYYAKSARHALTALVPHHGTLLKISKDGSTTEILANGFRAANGVCLNPDGSFIVTDQEGHWNPKNRINWVTKGGFYGNMFGYHDVTDSSDEAMTQPLCWITNSFDRSPAELLWVNGPAKWGPLNSSLLNFSYGYGKIYVVPHETVDGQIQGGMCEFPIAQFPTGVMRGRFSPEDGQLYCCGMFAWAGSQQQPGGFYRVRYTGKPVMLPIGLHAKVDGMEIEFAGELGREAAIDPENYSVKTWGLKRTANYGSNHYDEKYLSLEGVNLAADGKTVFLKIRDIKPTWCMEIKYALKDKTGKPVNGMIHNTVHKLAEPEKR